MNRGRNFESGWLADELKAAVTEVSSWSPGMRRGVEIQGSIRSEFTEVPKKSGKPTVAETNSNRKKSA